MPKTTAPRAQITETKFDDHVVIVPPNRLKSYVTRTGDSMEIATDPIARAETALKQIKGEFRGWMNTECDTIESVRATIHDDGPTEQSMERLFNAAHDIIGHGDVFGFPLARKIAESLCHLISSASQPAKLPLKLIDAHVDAVRAVVREGVHEADDRTGTEIYERLIKLTGAYLMKAGLASLPKVDAPKL
jgi:chemotaxis protein histidine kinase CheA